MPQQQAELFALRAQEDAAAGAAAGAAVDAGAAEERRSREAELADLKSQLTVQRKQLKRQDLELKKATRNLEQEKKKLRRFMSSIAEEDTSAENDRRRLNVSAGEDTGE